MMDYIDTKDLESLSGAVYFSVGRGTEGGSASYRLSVAGVTNSQWGRVGEVAANSGYSMGAIQVDFGQRGTWPVGAIEGRNLALGEKTYVDAVIGQASSYAGRNRLPFATDLVQLRADLLTHGNGQRGRSSIAFIDSNTRDSINAWASSSEGMAWIHANIDYPQVRNATQRAMAMLDTYGENIADERRFEAASILAKTANQAPAQLGKLEDVLKSGGNYDDLLAKAREIKANPRHAYYDGPKAAEVAARYAAAYSDPVRRESLARAQAKVSSVDFDPSTEASDADIQVALSAIGQRPRAQAQNDQTVWAVQANLNILGITDARGQPLQIDGNRGGRTNEAIVAFQRQSGLEGRQMSNAELLSATQVALNARRVPSFDQLPGLPSELQTQTPRMVNGVPEYLLPGRAQNTPPPANALADGVLRPSENGPQVRALQERLALIGAIDRYGQPTLTDGSYGDRTKEAVEQFQLWTGRETTGIADPGTLKALQEHAQFAVRHRAQGVAPGDHLTDNLKPATPNPAWAADPRPVQGREAARTAPTTPTSAPLSPIRSEQAPAPTPQAAPSQTNAPAIPDHLRVFSHPDNPRYDGYARFMRGLQEQPPIPGVTPDQYERIAAAFTAAQGTGRFFKEVGRFHLDKDGMLWASARPNSLISEKTRWEKIDLAQALSQTPEQAAAQWREQSLPAPTPSMAQTQTMTLDPQRLTPQDVRHPDHPQHGMFTGARGLLANEYDRWGLQRDPAQLDKEAAQVVAEARKQRMDSVSGITLTFPPGGTPDQPSIAVRENPASEFSKRVELKGERLAQAPQVEQTSTQLQQVEQQVALMQQQETQQRQEREQGQSQGWSV